MAQAAKCGALDFGCKMGEGLKNLADSAITDFVKSLYDGAVAFVAQVSTFWIDSPSPDVANAAVLSLRADMSWYVAGFAVLGFLAGLIRLVLSQDIKGSMVGIATPIVNLILAATAYATGIALLLTASDQFARWIVQRSTGGEIDLTQMLTVGAALLASPGTAFILYILLLLGAIINLLFMYFRDVMFLILSAFIVILAAASGSEQGRQAWRKANGWLIALLLFKPVAAGIYSLGFRMLVSGSAEEGKNSSIPEAMHATLIALLILLLAALALPALVKFVVPAAGVGAGAFSGGAALGAAVTVAAGAAVIASGGAALAGGAAAAGGASVAGGAGAAGATAAGTGAPPAPPAAPSGSGGNTPTPGGGGTGGGTPTPDGGDDGGGETGAAAPTSNSGNDGSTSSPNTSGGTGGGAPTPNGGQPQTGNAPTSDTNTGNTNIGAAFNQLNQHGSTPSGNKLDEAINEEGGE